MQYKIEKNIPIMQGVVRGPKFIYPFPLMKVGDSFSFKPEKGKNVISAAHSFGRARKQKFSVSRVVNRCWRVA